MSALPASSSHPPKNHRPLQRQRAETDYSSINAERLPSDVVRVSAERTTMAAGVSAVYVTLTTGVVYVAFARAIGANDFIFGVLASALPLMNLLQILAARMIEVSGKRKRQVLISGFIGRTLWILIALLPLLAQFFPHLLDKKRLLFMVIGGIALSGAFQAFVSPAYFSWITDLVPSRIRPMFLARRVVTYTWAAIVTALLAGLIADHWPHLTTYCIVLVLGGVCGMLDIAFYIGVREPRAAVRIARETNRANARPKSPSLLDMVRIPLQDVPTRRFLLFISILYFSYGLQGPFLWLYADEYLHLSHTTTSVLLSGIPLFSMALSMNFWGGVIRRYGTRPVQRFCSMGIAISSFGWLISRPGAWDVMPILLFFTGSLAGAIDLSSQNVITGLSPHVPRSSMTAVYSIAAGLSFALAAWCGGALAEALRWINQGDYSLFGLQLVNYHVLFLLALGLRLYNATFISSLLQEPASTSTVDVVKEVVPEVAQAFASRLSKPVGMKHEA
jgi:MFS family permease